MLDYFRTRFGPTGTQFATLDDPVKEAFTVELLNTGGLSRQAFKAKEEDFLNQARGDPVFTGVRLNALEDNPTLSIDMDESKVGALGLTLVAYWYARTRAGHDAFSFGTGKVYALAGFTSAGLLLMGAVGVLIESVERIVTPQTVHFAEAFPVRARDALAALRDGAPPAGSAIVFA